MLSGNMGRLHEEELVRIAFSSEADGFENEFIEAARDELNRRGIAAPEIQLLVDQKSQFDFLEENKSQEPLGTVWKIFLLIFSALWLTWIATAILKYRGYDQKFRDAWRWIFYGFGMWACIAVLFTLADVNGK